ncbi:hypothetical protein H8356DRAFT_924727 [Neocallimastix lanati (nom. inval.)]|uniref:G-protein coupled receptors family 3 profile domain-containing protein n=1 Tax=Neocallimastix californiae TaxID=1754190 RepID=A0A1Y2BJ94_9FUNG|nr:hypothetical protein H8356DRAFT_924727 [Neocallimastix sp. JGI-2020a]ORY34185.1 hypothetical protein LY90DRAFT_68951 [Neocallimastix californiae]|eukprot:ORY34185.1 hypothetical protein LY90DRAFT_68951 [Neocallimastix californiae]
MNNTYNTKIYGQTYSYCWDDVCSIPSVEREYIEFSQSKIEFDLEILECPENYLNQAINESNIKICYEPKCDKGCNGGKCIKNNVCKCTSTFFKGKYCNEYYKLERIRGMDIAIRVVLLILIIISVMLIVLLLIYRKRPEIKGGGVKFLIIILVGTIFNYSYSYFITYERTLIKCYAIYTFKYIGFSLVFGSILIKSKRIYRIFKGSVKIDLRIKDINIIAFLGLLVLYKIIIIVIWAFNQSVTLQTNNVIDLTILSYTSYIAYLIRDVEKNFKEDLAATVYIYFIFEILSFIVNENLNGISILVQDLISSLSSIIYTTSVIINLFIKRFDILYIHYKINKKT